jgi:hypothetical protein
MVRSPGLVGAGAIGGVGTCVAAVAGLATDGATVGLVAAEMEAEAAIEGVTGAAMDGGIASTARSTPAAEEVGAGAPKGLDGG